MWGLGEGRAPAIGSELWYPVSVVSGPPWALPPGLGLACRSCLLSFHICRKTVKVGVSLHSQRVRAVRRLPFHIVAPFLHPDRSPGSVDGF